MKYGNLIYDGRMECDYCRVLGPWHPSHLCRHCQQRCQCGECGGEFPWEEVRFGMCPDCHKQKPFHYQLVKKETPCHKS